MAENLVPPDTTLRAVDAQPVPLQNARGFFDPVESGLWLPPSNLVEWPSEPVPTPVDDRGLVNVPELLETVKSFVDTEYPWPGPSSTHHFYWPKYEYPRAPGKHVVNPAAFRNIGIHRAELPRVFENFLHMVTLPPEVPSDEVMQYRMQAWDVAVHLFDNVRNIVRWQRLSRRRAEAVERDPGILADRPEGDVYAQEYMAEMIGRHFIGVERHMERLDRVPVEFRIVEPANTPDELAATLGQIVVPRSLGLVRVVRNDTGAQLAA